MPHLISFLSCLLLLLISAISITDASPTTKNPTKQPTKPPTTTPTKLPTKFPTIKPTRFPTTKPTLWPTRNPTHVPTRNPSRKPTVRPTIPRPTLKSPTIKPGTTFSPTNRPSTQSPTNSKRPTRPLLTLSPSKSPVKTPSISPTRSAAPTKSPSKHPTVAGQTYFPTRTPSHTPSRSPSSSRPSTSPTHFPTLSPTMSVPTWSPSHSPTAAPTPPGVTLHPSTSPLRPTHAPSRSPSSSKPSKSPTALPTSSRPSHAPSKSPTSSHPSRTPSKVPSSAPEWSSRPSRSPSRMPSFSPKQSSRPSRSPTGTPSSSPKRSPTRKPVTRSPSRSPSRQPTTKTFRPSKSPSRAPSRAPSRTPSRAPFKTPSHTPSKAPSSHLQSKSPSRSPASRVPTTSTPTTFHFNETLLMFCREKLISHTCNYTFYSSDAFSTEFKRVVAIFYYNSSEDAQDMVNYYPMAANTRRRTQRLLASGDDISATLPPLSLSYALTSEPPSVVMSQSNRVTLLSTLLENDAALEMSSSNVDPLVTPTPTPVSNTGAIVGAVFGSIFVVALVVGGGLYYRHVQEQHSNSGLVSKPMSKADLKKWQDEMNRQRRAEAAAAGLAEERSQSIGGVSSSTSPARKNSFVAQVIAKTGLGGSASSSNTYGDPYLQNEPTIFDVNGSAPKKKASFRHTIGEMIAPTEPGIGRRPSLRKSVADLIDPATTATSNTLVVGTSPSSSAPNELFVQDNPILTTTTNETSSSLHPQLSRSGSLLDMGTDSLNRTVPADALPLQPRGSTIGSGIRRTLSKGAEVVLRKTSSSTALVPGTPPPDSLPVRSILRTPSRGGGSSSSALAVVATSCDGGDSPVATTPPPNSTQVDGDVSSSTLRQPPSIDKKGELLRPYFGEQPVIRKTQSGNFKPRTQLPQVHQMYNPIFASAYMSKTSAGLSSRSNNTNSGSSESDTTRNVSTPPPPAAARNDTDWT